MGLRFVRPEDCPALLEIYAQYIHTPITFEYELPSQAEFARRILEFSDFYPYLVWEEDGTILGYAYAHRQFERAAYQWNVELTVYLDQNAQARGLGTRLYRAVIELVRRQGMTYAYAYVTGGNARSCRLHERLGFTLASVFPNTGYKNGAWQDMCWYLMPLNPCEDQPQPPRSVHEQDPAAVERILREAETA